MRCLLTGGAGFIGSHLADLLLENGYEVIIIDNLSTGSEGNINKRADFAKVDIRELRGIEKYFKNIDFVFHLAAVPRIQPSFEEPIEHENVNVIGTINCLLAVRKYGVKKFVYSSSSSCYGDAVELPTSEKASIHCLSPYALQKYAAERYTMILGEYYKIPVVALRYFNVYGPRSFNPKNQYNAYSSVIGIFKNQKEAGEPLTITGDGEQSRDFVHVQDVVKANLMAAQANKLYQVYNVGFGDHFTINFVASLFESEHVYIPERRGEARITWANIDKIRKELDWKPQISLKEGIKLV